MNNNKLIILAKNPVLGKAKTRIGKEKGDELALAIYHRLLQHTRDTALETKAEKIVYFSDFIDSSEFWPIVSFRKKLQVPGNLGTKMRVVFDNELEENGKVIIIGSDCAEISTSDLNYAFELLIENDVVLGPAEDGGYYLIGMNKLHAELFLEMPWSQSNLLEKTLESTRILKLKVNLLPKKSDIDYYEDWVKLGWSI